jgi:kynureninase
MVSFYRPTKKRYKIICEEKHSDQYMFQSQVNFHGYKADDLWRLNVVTESIISTERMAKINEVGDELHWF